MVVSVRDESRQPRPIEVLGCSVCVVAGVMRLQPACQQLCPPMTAMDASGLWRIPRMLPPSRQVRRYEVVSVRDKRCQTRPIEVLGCSPRVVVGVMRLQSAC